MMEEVQKATETAFVGVNTQMPNILIKEALVKKQFPQWASMRTFQTEPRLGAFSIRYAFDLGGPFLCMD